jgi:hypothetical protein
LFLLKSASNYFLLIKARSRGLPSSAAAALQTKAAAD